MFRLAQDFESSVWSLFPAHIKIANITRYTEIWNTVHLWVMSEPLYQFHVGYTPDSGDVTSHDICHSLVLIYNVSLHAVRFFCGLIEFGETAYELSPLNRLFKGVLYKFLQLMKFSERINQIHNRFGCYTQPPSSRVQSGLPQCGSLV